MSIEYFITGVSIAVTTASVTAAAVPLLFRIIRFRKKTDENKLRELQQEIETLLLHQKELEMESRRYSVELEDLIQHHKELVQKEFPNRAAEERNSQTV